VLPSSPSNTTEYVFVNDPTTRDHWAVDRKIKPGLYFDWLSERRGNYIFSAVEQFKPKSSSFVNIFRNERMVGVLKDARRLPCIVDSEPLSALAIADRVVSPESGPKISSLKDFVRSFGSVDGALQLTALIDTNSNQDRRYERQQFSEQRQLASVRGDQTLIFAGRVAIALIGSFVMLRGFAARNNGRRFIGAGCVVIGFLILLCTELSALGDGPLGWIWRK